MKIYPVKFFPIAQQRIWGGNRLKEWFGISTAEPVGEYWTISGHPHATSVVMNGWLAGKTLVQLTEEFPLHYLGNSPQQRFPLLVKFLEAREDLSVQIHPNDAYAREVEGDFGKTEAWYILDHKPGAAVVYDHSFRDREEFFRAVQENRIPHYLRMKEIAKDELIFIPAQTLHALRSGTILIEIQQTSDVTYRVYDWDRVDQHGNRRELHVEKAADTMIFAGENPIRKQSTLQRFPIEETPTLKHEHLLTCPYFSIEKICLQNGRHHFSLGKEGNPDVLIVAEGSGLLSAADQTDDLRLQRGDTVLIPGTLQRYTLHAQEHITLLRTYY